MSDIEETPVPPEAVAVAEAENKINAIKNEINNLRAADSDEVKVEDKDDKSNAKKSSVPREVKSIKYEIKPIKLTSAQKRERIEELKRRIKVEQRKKREAGKELTASLGFGGLVRETPAESKEVSVTADSKPLSGGVDEDEVRSVLETAQTQLKENYLIIAGLGLGIGWLLFNKSKKKSYWSPEELKGVPTTHGLLQPTLERQTNATQETIAANNGCFYY